MLFNLFKKKKCKICGTMTKEEFYIDNKIFGNEHSEITSSKSVKKYLCRGHLIEEFKKSFLAFPKNMIVFHPELEMVCKNLYSYYTLSDLKACNFDNTIINNSEKLLSKIKGKCSRCDSEAQILYFSKGVLKYHNYIPQIENINFEDGKLYCSKHGLESIISDLQTNKSIFNEGLYAPFRDSGVYISTYL